MGVCLSKPSESSPLVDAGGSAASRLESSRGGVVESFVDAQPLTALAERLRAGDRVAVDDYVATSEDERVPQRRKIDAGHSVAMNTGASGSNPPMLSGSLPDARDAEAGDAAAAVADAGDRARDAAEFVLPQCPQVDGLRVPPPDTTGLDPAEGWRRPTQEWVNKEVTSIVERLGATEEHARVFLNKLRNPKAVGNAPPKLVDTWVCALANAVASGKMDYGNRFAYGAFNLLSALPLAATNTWSIPSDCNMVTEPRPILNAARKPAVDSQFTLSSKLLCLTKELENVFVEFVFHRRDIDLDDVGGVCPDGHISYDEFPGYKAADKAKYREYFNGNTFPPEPENFGKFPPDALSSATAYVLRSAAYPLFSVNGKGPNTRTLDLIERLDGKYEKLDDQLARKLGSPYGLSSIEYAADKEHYGMYFVFMPRSEADGHLMLITLNPQFGSTAGGAFGGGSAAHAELCVLLKTQADVIRTLSDCDVLPMDREHPLWRFVGDLGMRHVFRVASDMRAADERGERYATRHVRVGRKYGYGGSDQSKEQKEARNEGSKRGGEACIRGMPKITCPICRASDVRLTWTVVRRIFKGKSVRYEHVRSCSKDGVTKTRSKTFKLGADEWEKFLLGNLDNAQIKTHKEEVSCEVQRLDNTC